MIEAAIALQRRSCIKPVKLRPNNVTYTLARFKLVELGWRDLSPVFEIYPPEEPIVSSVNNVFPSTMYVYVAHSSNIKPYYI